VRADPAGSCLLGVSTEVARIIASFSITELDWAVERRFRYLRPRWEDRPAVWRALLLSAQRGDIRRSREVHLRALQLITGELLLSRSAMHRLKESQPRHPAPHYEVVRDLAFNIP
jgi:hypothetical protein